MSNLVPALFAFGSLLYGFVMFDRLVKLQYAKHRSDWYFDGCPVGFFCRPPETTWKAGARARERLSLILLFMTPSWARECEDAGHLLHHMRVAVAGWNFTIIVLVFSSGFISRLL